VVIPPLLRERHTGTYALAVEFFFAAALTQQRKSQVLKGDGEPLYQLDNVNLVEEGELGALYGNI
jgi:hypothetical protein